MDDFNHLMVSYDATSLIILTYDILLPNGVQTGVRMNAYDMTVDISEQVFVVSVEAQ